MLDKFMKEYPALCEITGTRRSIFNTIQTLFFAVFFLLLSLTGSATVYYVSNSGDDSNDGLSEATSWRTLNKVTWYGAFKSGDKILLKRGDVWREQFVIPPHNEVSDNPLIIGAYGKGNNPVITGADNISGMTSIGDSIWQKTGVTIEPCLMYFNGISGIRHRSLNSLDVEGEWYWNPETNVFSIYTESGDPSGNIELGQRKKIVDLSNRHHTVLRNITIQHSNESSVMGGENWGSGGIFITDGSYLTVTECTIQENGLYGVMCMNSSNITLDNNTFLRCGETNHNGANVRFYASTTGITNITFTNNQCNYSGQDGLLIHTNLKENYITNVEIYGNTFNNNDAAALYVQKVDSALVYDNYFDSNGNGSTLHEDYSIGISSCDNSDFYNNIITNQLYNDAIQLYSDQRIDYGHAHNVRIFNNYVSGITYGDGISVATMDSANSQNVQIFNNVIVSADHNGINLWHNDAGTAGTVYVYNNTIYKSLKSGIRSTSKFPYVLKNNIFYLNVEADVLCWGGTTGLTTSNNLYHRIDGGTILDYNGNTYTTESITNFEPTAQTGDPLFTDAANGDFSLQAGSPAINNGVDVGLTEDILGNPILGTTDIGAVELQMNGEKQTKYTTEDISICEGNSYMGWTTTGEYQRTLIASSGADSTVITNLTVNPVFHVSEEITLQEGESYEGWTATGKYERTLTSAGGCDSIVITTLTVEPLHAQTIHLEKGWNIFSSYLVPVNNNMHDVLMDTHQENHRMIVEDEEGNTYEKNGNKLVSTIPGLEITEGYKIKVQQSGVIEIPGQPVKLPFSIPLKNGWNIISFPYNGAADALDVLQPLIEEGTLVKAQDEKGNSVEYWGDDTGWINGIGNFEPGEGYLVQVNREETLTIEENYFKTGQLSLSSLPPDYFSIDYEGNGSGHMNINIGNLTPSGLKAGDEIAAYDGDVCVGAVKLSEINIQSNAVSIPASVSDENLLNGFREGNPIEIRIRHWNKSASIEASSEVVKGNLIYQRHGSVFINLLKNDTTGINESRSLINVDIYPNPATDKVYVRFSQEPDPETRIILTDLTGKQQMIYNVQSTLEVLNVQSLPTGIYLVKTVTGNNYAINKIVIK